MSVEIRRELPAILFYFLVVCGATWAIVDMNFNLMAAVVLSSVIFLIIKDQGVSDDERKKNYDDSRGIS